MRFNNNQLRQLTQNFVFSYAFMPHPSNRIPASIQAEAENLWADLAFKKNVLRLKNIFISKTEALLHGDLHTGSIMLNQDETFIIDPEFAFVGPFGFDIGALLANLIMAWLSHFELIHHQSYHHIDDVIRTIQKHAATYNEKTFPLQSHSNNKNAMTV